MDDTVPKHIRHCANAARKRSKEYRAVDMAIETHLDIMLAKRKMTSKELAKRIGLSENNLSRIKTGHIKAIRWSTLEAICRELDCQPGDLLEYVPD